MKLLNTSGKSNHAILPFRNIVHWATSSYQGQNHRCFSGIDSREVYNFLALQLRTTDWNWKVHAFDHRIQHYIRRIGQISCQERQHPKRETTVLRSIGRLLDETSKYFAWPKSTSPRPDECESELGHFLNKDKGAFFTFTKTDFFPSASGLVSPLYIHADGKEVRCLTSGTLQWKWVPETLPLQITDTFRISSK